MSSLQTAIKIGGIGMAVAAIWWLTSDVQLFPSKRLTKEKLIEALKALSIEFHDTFMEWAQITKNVHRMQQVKGVEKSLTIEQLEGLFVQRGMQSRLEAAEQRICQSFGCTRAGFKGTQKRDAEDPVVAELSRGFTVMYKDSMEGLFPLLPGVSIPPALTTDKLLEVLQLISDEKLKRFKIILTDPTKDKGKHHPIAGYMPPDSLARELTETSDEVEKLILAEHKYLFNGDMVVFQAAKAAFSRDSKFTTKKLELDKSHQEGIIQLMQAAAPESDSNSLTNVPVVELSSKLDQTTAEELELRLTSAQDSNTPVILLVLDQERYDHTSQLVIFSKSTESFEQDCTFVYMSFHEARKSSNELVKQAGIDESSSTKQSDSSETNNQSDVSWTYIVFNQQITEKFDSVDKVKNSIRK